MDEQIGRPFGPLQYFLPSGHNHSIDFPLRPKMFKYLILSRKNFGFSRPLCNRIFCFHLSLIYKNRGMFRSIDIFGGGPPKFWLSVLFYRAPAIDVLLHFWERLFVKLGFVLFYGTRFFSKNFPKIWYIFGNFCKKSMFYTLKWKDFEEFWWNHLWNSMQAIFRKSRKFLKIWPPKPPKIHLLIFS